MNLEDEHKLFKGYISSKVVWQKTWMGSPSPGFSILQV